MVGINVPLPVPVAYFSFGGWKRSLFGDMHIYGPEAVRFYTRSKVITQRWPSGGVRETAKFSFPGSDCFGGSVYGPDTPSPRAVEENYRSIRVIAQDERERPRR